MENMNNWNDCWIEIITKFHHELLWTSMRVLHMSHKCISFWPQKKSKMKVGTFRDSNKYSLFKFSVALLASCSAKTLIVGGSDAVPHSQPHILSLRRSILNSHYCGGSVVSASKGVSAAHCASNRASTAVAGAHDFSSPNANEETLSYKFTRSFL